MYLKISEYQQPILAALKDLNGGGSVREVAMKVYEKSYQLLTFDDVTRVTSDGEVAWKNRMRWAKSRLVKAGLIVGGRVGGWKLTKIEDWKGEKND
jgi:restriction endonuclease Mrr